jgi:DNA-binding IclR family transcriptional regulator
MIRLGWLDKPGDRYRIGNKLFEVSGLVPVRHELREAVLPFLQDLYAATRTTVQLGVLDGLNVLVVEKITGHHRMPMLSQVGGRIPAHCSAMGRAILAFSDGETVDSALAAGLEPRTARTVTSPDALRRVLAAIPDRGWATEREEGNIGVACVAAPIFGPLNVVVAAVSVTGPGSGRTAWARPFGWPRLPPHGRTRTVAEPVGSLIPLSGTHSCRGSGQALTL